MKTTISLIGLLTALFNGAYAQLETEPNNGFATADEITLVDLMALVNGSIYGTGDNDYFKVNVPRAGVFDLTLNSLEGGIDGVITIFDADENELADEIESGAAPVYLRHLVCESGDY
ncbi:MAG: hypothetical protein GQ574_05855, partial [Crocinitomix sp.]|nr:hypothetical protein [Crocinitomix sp.]